MVKPIDAQNVDMNIGDQMKFCPKCGSSNIEWTLPQTWSKWECRVCGYIGAFIIEDGAIAEEIKKEYLKNKEKIEE
jgi:hypothetical protein